MIRIVIGVVVFAIGFATYQAGSGPEGGRIWLGGMIAGATLVAGGLLRLYHSGGRDLIGFDPGNEDHTWTGDAPSGSVQSRWFTNCEVCGRTVRAPRDGGRAIHPECAPG